MRVAVPIENENINQHFGQSEQFRLYEIEGGMILSSQDIHTGCTGHEAIVQFLTLAKANVVICGGIGGGARAGLLNAGIMFYPGIIGPADTAAKMFAEGRLTYNEPGSCHHMDAGGGCPHHTHAGDADCGSCSGCAGHDMEELSPDQLTQVSGGSDMTDRLKRIDDKLRHYKPEE